MRNKKVRGQVTLEFLFIFGLLTILLLYSVRNTSFSEGSPSVENLRIQVALEEKSLANAIANTISQVYAQGLGSKATTYVKVTYLNKESYLSRAYGYEQPIVKIFMINASDRNNPSGISAGILVSVTENREGPAVSGDDKNAFFTPMLYNYTGNAIKVKFFSEEDTRTPKISDIPSDLRIVVEWNPDEPADMEYNETSGTLWININPGG
ncbi:class III signal peptide-containing protein [Thermococcus indicus]|uniref:Class III signal peptide-containing protein n=1 Tax=Thermococcus indicus TaxID=2586643 RepID=A0A4Y5SIP3_9EURY|nr:class III signal peptide-containing protein [Thermococcus indicus]QDA30677.1 class III signal peptide-containing protein [Thermococcus indicus]